MAPSESGESVTMTAAAEPSPAATVTPVARRESVVSVTGSAAAAAKGTDGLWEQACAKSSILYGMMQPEEDASLDTLLRPPLTYPSLQEDFSKQMIPLTSDAMISQLFETHPWSDATRRVKLSQFLQSLMLCSDPELRLKGTLGVWELATNRDCHPDIKGPMVWLLVNQVSVHGICRATCVRHVTVAWLWAEGRRTRRETSRKGER
jgi:hypothetical protein